MYISLKSSCMRTRLSCNSIFDATFTRKRANNSIYTFSA